MLRKLFISTRQPSINRFVPRRLAFHRKSFVAFRSQTGVPFSPIPVVLSPTFCPAWQKHGKSMAKSTMKKMKNNVTYVYICIYSTLNVTISCLEDYQTLFLEHD